MNREHLTELLDILEKRGVESFTGIWATEQVSVVLRAPEPTPVGESEVEKEPIPEGSLQCADCGVLVLKPNSFQRRNQTCGKCIA